MSVTEDNQRFEALAIANRRRVRGANVRRHIRGLPLLDGVMEVARFLKEQDDDVWAMPVSRLVFSVHRLYEKKGTPMLFAAGIHAHHKRVRDLTDRQREALAVGLERFVEERR
jgi:hypothetical protein